MNKPILSGATIYQVLKKPGVKRQHKLGTRSVLHPLAILCFRWPFYSLQHRSVALYSMVRHIKVSLTVMGHTVLSMAVLCVTPLTVGKTYAPFCRGEAYLSFDCGEACYTL